MFDGSINEVLLNEWTEFPLMNISVASFPEAIVIMFFVFCGRALFRPISRYWYLLSFCFALLLMTRCALHWAMISGSCDCWS